jgi:GDP-D-mannose dehydratase
MKRALLTRITGLKLGLDTRRAGIHAEIRVDPTRLRPREIPWLLGDPGKLVRLDRTRRRLVRDALLDVLEVVRA